MPDLTPASPDDLRDTLAGALRRKRGGRATQQYAEVMSLAAAEHLVEAMRLAGFVVMRQGPAPDHTGALPPHAVERTGPEGC